MENDYMNNNPEQTTGQQDVNYGNFGSVPNAGGFGGQEAPQPAKKNLGVIIGAAAAAAVVIIGVVVGALTNWFGLAGGPLGGLVKAIEKTLKVNSITAEIDADAESDGYDSSASMNIRFQYDKKEEEFIAWVENDDATIAVDGKHMYYYSDDWAYSEKVDFDEYADLYADFRGSGEIDYDDIIDELGLDDYIKGKNVEDFLDSFKKECLGNKKWLEKNLGFEKKGNTYTFNAEVDELLEEIIDRADDAKVLDVDKDDIEDVVDTFKGIELEVIFTVKNGKISKFNFEMADDDHSVSCTVEITDVNKTKITQDEIDDLKDDVENWEDDDDYNHNHDYDDEYDDEYYDDEEYYEEEDGYGYCDSCSSYDELYDWDGEQLCWECYLDA